MSRRYRLAVSRSQADYPPEWDEPEEPEEVEDDAEPEGFMADTLTPHDDDPRADFIYDPPSLNR